MHSFLNKKIFSILLILVIVFTFFGFISKSEAASCTANTTGNWNTAGTWTCDTAPTNHVPLSTDDVVVTAAVTTTITVDTAAVAKSVTVTNTAIASTQNITLAVDGNSLTISTGGGITINGGGATNRNARVTVSTGTITIPGNITFNNVRAQFISTGASTTNIGGNFGSSGTLTTSSTGTINFNGGVAQTIGIYSTYNNIQINNTSGNVTLTGATTFGGTLLVNTGTLDTASGTLVVVGATTVNGTLLISNTLGAKTFNNNITIASSGIMNFTAAETLTEVGNLTINNGGTMSFNAAGIVALTGNLTIDGTGVITGTTGLWTFAKVGGGTIGGTTSNTLSLGSATFTTSYSLGLTSIIPTVTVTGALVVLTNNSTLTANTALSGTGTFIQGSGSIINIGATSAITILDASASTNEVHYTRTTGSQTIHAGTYYHLFIDKSGQTATVATPGITVNGNLNVTAGNLSDGGFQIIGNATGNFILPAGSTLTLGLAGVATTFPTVFTNANISLNTTSTVNYNTTAAQTVSNVPTYGNLTMTGASTKTVAGAITINGNLNNATATTGIFADGGFTITVKGNSAMTGPHTGTGKILFTSGLGVHVLTGVGSYTNVELDDSNGVTQSANTTINGTFTLTTGTWTISTQILTVTGTTTINSAATLALTSATGAKKIGDLVINTGGTIIGPTGILTFQKAGGGTISGTATSLTLGGSAIFTTDYTLPFPFTTSAMTVTNATVTNATTTTINGTLSGTGTFTQNSSTTLNVISASIAILNATASGNIVHYIGAAAGTVKGTSYVDLDIIKTTGFNANASGTVNVTGNLTVTSGTLNFAGSIFTVAGTTDIYDKVTDISGGPAGGNNIFQGMVTMHPGANWFAVVGEVTDFHFQNGLVVNGASFVSSSGIYYFETNNQSISGSFSPTIDSISVDGIQLTNNSTGTIISRATLAGTGEFIQGINAVLNIIGTSPITTLTASASGNIVNYNGTVAQTVHSGTYQTLTVNGNTFGSVDITADTTTNTLLNLGATKLITSTNKFIVGTSATVSRTSGYVIGTIQKQFNSSTSFAYDIGDANDYTPATPTFSGVSGSGSVDATVANTDHADTTAGTTPVNKDKSINRYWTLTNNALSFTSYGLVLDFVSGDIDPGAVVANMIVAEKVGGVWSIVPSSCSGTSCTVTGLTVMGDFQIGETISYVLTYMDGGNGSIVGTSPQIVNSGADGSLVTATPNTGYHFTSWSDGVLTASRTDTNVTANISVTASFALTVGVLDNFTIDTIGTQTAGVAFGVVITAKDLNENTVIDYTGTVNLTTNSGSISPTTSGAFVGGTRTESVTLIGSGTGRTITAIDSGKTGTSNTFDVTSAVTQFVIINPTDTTVGDDVTVRVEAQDASGTIVTTYNNTVTLVASSHATGAGAVNIVGGFGTKVITDIVAETVDLTLTDTHSLDGTSTQDVIFSPGNLHHFIIDNIASPQIAGVDIGVTITAKDSYGNTVPSFTGKVNFSTTAGTITPSSSDNFTAGTLIQNVKVTLSGLGKTIMVTRQGGSENGTSNSFTVNPGVTYKYILNSPSNIMIGNRAGYIVKREDQYSNLVTSGTDTVYLYSTSGPTSLFYDATTLGNEITQIDISEGLSQINFWYFDDNVGTWTITASDGISAPNSTGIVDANDVIEVTIVPIVATRLVILDIPDATAGDTVTVYVQAQDDSGSVDTGYAGSVNLAATSPSGNVSPGGIVTLTSGEGTINIIDTKAEIVTLTLNTPSPTLDVSSIKTATLIPGAFSYFDMVDITSPQIAGSDFTLIITAKDTNENIATSFIGTVDFTTTAGTIAPLISSNFSAGVLNQNVKVSLAGTDKTITATKTSDIQYKTSNLFSVNPGSVASFIVEASGGGDISTKTIGIPFDLKITALDSFGNIATGFTGSVTISSTGTLSSGGGSASSFTAGILSAHSVTISNSGTFTIAATNTSGSEIGISDSFNVSALPIVATRFIILDPLDVQVGHSTTVTVEAVDDAGNRDDTFQADINLVVSGAATGGGLVDIVNGAGTRTITDNTVETVTLSLSDITPPTTLDFSSTQIVVFTATPPSGGGGGGGARIIAPTISFTGRAFPQANIELMAIRNGQVPIVSTSKGTSAGNFDVVYSGKLPSDVKTFALVVYGKDKHITQTKLFILGVNDQLFTTILMAPTVELKQQSVSLGTFMGITGSAMPKYKIELMVDGIKADEIATVDNKGNYNLNFNTYRLGLGEHTLKIRQVDAQGKNSDYSIEKTFLVTKYLVPKADLNIDGKVDITDWSIFIARYNSVDAVNRADLDLNSDGIIDIKDFSFFIDALMQ